MGDGAIGFVFRDSAPKTIEASSSVDCRYMYLELHAIQVGWHQIRCHRRVVRVCRPVVSLLNNTRWRWTRQCHESSSACNWTAAALPARENDAGGR
ncbi:hypothetical protein JG688_00003998 [Phytophthora aleatoria]|uniref:Uncharacterized protein n=1 Tax=Phytophthora aleatoria TaxID=2496075 RepID=A0A8J5M9P4_9STRA|nr:hypothetical protein JG688_00003998 [Phytophthora aleatoria]